MAGKRSAPKKQADTAFERQRGIARLLSAVLVLLLVAVIGVMVLSQFFDIAILKMPRQMVARVITPIQGTFARGTDFIVDYLRRVKLRSNLEYEYNLLREKLDEATDQAMLVNELQRQLQAAADLNDEISRNPNLNGIRANIIGRDTSNYTYTLTLDVGSNQGVKEDMAVVYPGALVGIIYDVDLNSCKVKAIIDTDCSIPALIESNRDQGTVRGTLAIDGEYNCRMYYLSYTTLPRPGDLVVTSGEGLGLPKGIPVGRVRESTRGLEDSKQYIVLEPIADFFHLEYLIVYRYISGDTQVVGGAPRTVPTFVPLPSIKPVPTLIGQAEPVTPIDASPSPSPSPSVTPGASPTITPAPLITPDPDGGYSYNAPLATQVTATLEPTVAPVTPSPTPSFSPEELTVEEDN